LVKCLRQTLLALLISTIGTVSACIGQSYTWNANFGEADWQDPNSWTPARNAPSINDQLYFSNGGSSIATNIPSETVGFIFLENASQVTFHSALPGNSLTMSGSAMVKLYLDWNTSLVVGDGVIAMNIQFTGAPSDIAEVLGSLMITPMCALNTTNSDFQLVGELTISGSLQGDIVNNGVITFDHSNQLTYNGSISGIGSLNKSGSGTLSLTGASSYDGLTSVQQGVLNLQNNNALGSSVGGTLVQSGAQLELQGDIEINIESLTLNQSSTGLEAQGGIVTVVGGFTTHTFSDIGSSILSVLSAGQADVLIVGGGGGGGMGTGGGGGGGGFIELLGYTLNEGDVSITIGSGGNGASATQNPTNGEGSSFGSMVAAGGGFGGGLASAGGDGSPGASGGGGSWGNTAAGAFTAGQGNAGGSGRLGFGNFCSFDPYSAGGGGGAGGNGENGSITKSGDGGEGLYSAISGTPVGYCGGGGGGADSFRCTNQGLATPEFGGANGGNDSPGLDAVDGRGGGGGGGSNDPNQSGGHGGSGVVIVRYSNTTLNAVSLENVAGNNRWNGPVILNTDVTVLTTSGELTISGIISENVNNKALTKTGAGVLTVTGNNLYTGNTNVGEGTLQLGAPNVIDNSSNITLNGGTLHTGATTGFSETAGTLDLSASSTIALGLGNHTLTFSNSNVVNWTGSTILTINGWTGNPGESGTSGRIFVGNSADGLNELQLSQINFNGYGSGSMLLNTGELVPLEVVVGCTNPSACNFNPDATINDGSCIAAIGEPCDDGLEATENDQITIDCTCAGTTVIPDCCTGDFNCDGVYSVADLLILISDFGCVSIDCIADLDDDFVVGVSDLQIFIGLYGLICP
jgi:autotransporter-associated beta strand protein